MQSVREYHRELRMDFGSEMEEDIKSIQLYTAVICPIQNNTLVFFLDLFYKRYKPNIARI